MSYPSPNNWDDDLRMTKYKIEDLLNSIFIDSSVKIKTVHGHYCKVPFMYEGYQINGCTYKDLDQPWCAVSLDGNSKILEWDVCPTNWGE